MASLRIVLRRFNRRTTYLIGEATYQTAVSTKLPYSTYFNNIKIQKSSQKYCKYLHKYLFLWKEDGDKWGKQENLTVQIHFNLSTSQIHIHVPSLSGISLSIVSISSGTALSLLIHPHLNSFTHYLSHPKPSGEVLPFLWTFASITLPTCPFSLFLQHLFQLELCLKPTLFLTVNIVFTSF